MTPRQADGAESRVERHPAVDIDEVVHQRVRLGIMAILHATDAAEFTYLKQILELTDGNLSRHLDVLEDAGFVVIHKTDRGRRRTTVMITDAGRRAFAAELASIRKLAELAPPGLAPPGLAPPDLAPPDAGPATPEPPSP